MILYHKFKDTIFDEEFTLGYILAWFYLVLSFITLFSPIAGDYQEFCIFQGIIVIMSGLGGLLLTGYIALYLYIKCYKGNPNYTTPFCKVLTIILAICGLVAGVPAGTDYINQHKETSMWCWISPGKDKDVIKKNVFIYVYYMFVWTIIIWNVYSYCLNARRFSDYRDSNARRNIRIRLRAYSIILLVFYVPQTIVRILQSAGVKPTDGFLYFSAVLIRLLGLANSLAYGMIPEVRTKIREMFQNANPDQTIEAIPAVGCNIEA